MSLPALLLFIFAPVLGLLFAPVLSALVRVRIGAVLSALIVAVSLSVGAPALAGWTTNCESDAWDDTPRCSAYSGSNMVRWNRGHFPSARDRHFVNSLRYFCDGTGTQKVSLHLRFVRFFSSHDLSHASISLAGFATADGHWTSGGEFRLHKFQTRWDTESSGDGAFLQPSESGVNDDYPDKNQYYWQWAPSDWWGWEALEMTPASSNPIRLLQTKSQLRIRVNVRDAIEDAYEPVVFTYSLEDAAEAIAEAKRGCGL